MRYYLKIGVQGKPLLVIEGPERELREIRKCMGGKIRCFYTLQLVISPATKRQALKYHDGLAKIRIPKPRKPKV